MLKRDEANKKTMKYGILQINDHAAVLSVWNDHNKIKEEQSFILDETWFIEGSLLWQNYLKDLIVQELEALFVQTNKTSAYIASRYELPTQVFFLQQYLQEQTTLPIIDGLPDKTDDIVHYVEAKVKNYTWRLSYYGFVAGTKEKVQETLLTVGNGYLGLRGAMVETRASASHYPGLYLMNGYNRSKTKVGSQMVSYEDLVNFPNFQFFTLKLAGEPSITPDETNIKEVIRELDLRNGLYVSRMILDCGAQRLVEVVSQKVANMDNYHQVGLSYTVKPLNFSGKITIITEVDTNIKNSGVSRYQNLDNEHFNVLSTKIQMNFVKLVMETVTAKMKVQQTIFIKPFGNPEVEGMDENKLQHHFTYRLQDGETCTVEKIIDMRTNLDEKTLNDQMKITSMAHITFETLLTESSEIWKEFWEQTDIEIIGDILSQHLLRINTYHLLITASPKIIDLNVPIGVRGLHGEADRGHIFWDEIFLVPFYLRNFPQIVRQMLLYRYRRLDKAKSYAQAHGYRGAMYPWQSGVSGSEESQTLQFNPVSRKWDADYSVLQRHVSLAIAYNTIMYIRVSGDLEFLQKYGGEMLWEIALFWSSLAQRDQATGRYSINGVMGPDAFHEKYPNAREGGINNNAYTNLMVAWLFRELPKIYALLNKEDVQRLFENIHYNMADYQKMQTIAHMLTVDIEDDIIAQHEGYFALDEIDLEAYKLKYGDIQYVNQILRAEHRNTDDYKVIKQADTLMTFYNLPAKTIDMVLSTLGYELGPYYFERNFLYYLKRTAHGSSLSYVVHTYLASMAGMKQLAWEFYQLALHDLGEDSTAEGIHASVMAGSVSLTLLTYAGLDYRQEVLTLQPDLPAHWQCMRFKAKFRQAVLNIVITQTEIQITSTKNIVMNILGVQRELNAHEKYIYQYEATEKIVS